MMFSGITEAWGQTDYSGTYYIYSNNKGTPGSTTADRFYLCPSTDYYAAKQPFVTTYKTNKGTNSKWKIQYVETVGNKNYYHVIHVATDGNDVDKYLTYNDQIVISGNYAEARLRVHLQEELDNSEGHEDYNLFYISTGNVEGSIVICPKADTSERSLNPAKDNKTNYQGTSDGNAYIDYNGNSKKCGGLIGLWEKSDYNSIWYLEEYIQRPTFSSSSKDEITISHVEENATIYYTIDDTNPTTTHYDGSGLAPLQIDMPANAVKLKAIATKSDNLPSCISNIRVVPNATITLANTSLTYNGSAQTIDVTSVKDGVTTIPTSEYEVGYSNNTNAGDESIVSITNQTGGDYIVYSSTTFSISKKDLSITAKPKTITYGEEPANDGVTYSGFAGEDNASTLTGTLTYAYNYSQYGDAGSYTITPSGLVGDNYDISYVDGTLTVDQKVVGLTWSETTSFPYDGTSHILTATATGMVNGDEIDVAVSGAQTNAGNHTATASELAGTKAGNYKLPTEKTHAFTITPVGLTVTANNNTITYGDAPAGNGVTCEGFVNSETASVLGGTLDYDYSYTQYGDVGDTYTITPKGLTSTNYAISFVAGTLTVGQKEVGITWGETRSFVYDGIAHAPTATATGLVNNDAITVIVTGAQTNVGGYTATASELTGSKVDNYKLPAANTRSFTISAKSLGDGDFPAEDITIQLTSEGELEYVKDGGIILITDNDYTYEINTEGSDKIVEVNGIGNYTGSFRGIYANPRFYDVDGEGAGKAAAVYMSSRDINTFEGVDAYTVKSVNTFLGLLTVSKLEYIPKGVPVLLLSESEATGFVVSKKNENIADISESTVNSNLLKMAPAAGIPVETAQAYMFYLGEFVLTKAGTITAGKFYLNNPNYSDTPADPASAPVRRSLMIVEEETTDIANMLDKGSKPADDVWYTLDGRRLSSKPVNKGLYIHHGRKTIIK